MAKLSGGMGMMGMMGMGLPGMQPPVAPKPEKKKAKSKKKKVSKDENADVTPRAIPILPLAGQGHALPGLAMPPTQPASTEKPPADTAPPPPAPASAAPTSATTDEPTESLSKEKTIESVPPALPPTPVPAPSTTTPPTVAAPVAPSTQAPSIAAPVAPVPAPAKAPAPSSAAPANKPDSLDLEYETFVSGTKYAETVNSKLSDIPEVNSSSGLISSDTLATGTENRNKVYFTEDPLARSLASRTTTSTTADFPQGVTSAPPVASAPPPPLPSVSTPAQDTSSTPTNRGEPEYSSEDEDFGTSDAELHVVTEKAISSPVKRSPIVEETPFAPLDSVAPPPPPPTSAPPPLQKVPSHQSGAIAVPVSPTATGSTQRRSLSFDSPPPVPRSPSLMQSPPPVPRSPSQMQSPPPIPRSPSTVKRSGSLQKSAPPPPPPTVPPLPSAAPPARASTSSTIERTISAASTAARSHTTVVSPSNTSSSGLGAPFSAAPPPPPPSVPAVAPPPSIPASAPPPITSQHTGASLKSQLETKRTVEATTTTTTTTTSSSSYNAGSISGYNDSTKWWLTGSLPTELTAKDAYYEVDSIEVRKRGGRHVKYSDYYIIRPDLSGKLWELSFDPYHPESDLLTFKETILERPIPSREYLAVSSPRHSLTMCFLN
ncbi:unnamed protein product [Ambrosiozyma monospora]|uniref:Unnamed protein product n=1 Tax=Ambrosiozyma monospora TaxID=43982 RepID=A0ACB5TIM7_AMBMO|nr:unnamed protein product [Ambrosiozyma monospora]